MRKSKRKSNLKKKAKRPRRKTKEVPTESAEVLAEFPQEVHLLGEEKAEKRADKERPEGQPEQREGTAEESAVKEPQRGVDVEDFLQKQEAKSIAGHVVAKSVESALPKGAGEAPPDESIWIQLKPVRNRIIMPFCMGPILDYIHGTGQTFEFLILRPDTDVKYFLRIPDRAHANTIITKLAVANIVADTCEPPKIAPESEAELTLKRSFVYPLVDLDLQEATMLKIGGPSGPLVNPAHVNISGTWVSGLQPGTAVRIRVRADGKASAVIQSKINKTTGIAKGIGGTLVDMVLGVGKQIARGDGFSQGPPTQPTTPEVQAIQRQLQAQRVSAMLDRAGNRFFRCEAKVYGAQGQIKQIVNSFPRSSNCITESRCRRLESPPNFSDPLEPSAKERLKGWVSRSSKLRSLVLFGTPLFILYLSYALGFFNPIDILGQIFGGVGLWKEYYLTAPDIISLSAAGTSFFVLLLLILRRWKIPKPLVLTLSELSALASIPVNWHLYNVEEAPAPQVGFGSMMGASQNV